MVRDIHRKKKLIRAVLDRNDLRRNDKEASNRVIVENFFARETVLWAIMANLLRMRNGFMGYKG